RRAARVALIDGKYVLNPTLDQQKQDENRMDLVVAGTNDAVMMVESEIEELTEEQVLGGVMFAHDSFQPVIQAIFELAEHAAKEPFDFEPEDTEALKSEVKQLVGAEIVAAYQITAKGARHDAVSAAKAKVMETLARTEARPDGVEANKLAGVFKDCEADVVRRGILETGER